MKSYVRVDTHAQGPSLRSKGTEAAHESYLGIGEAALAGKELYVRGFSPVPYIRVFSILAVSPDAAYYSALVHSSTFYSS